MRENSRPDHTFYSLDHWAQTMRASCDPGGHKFDSTALLSKMFLDITLL